MSYIQFDKKQLVELGHSLNKEIIRSNKSGAYSSTTIIGCNTKRYHGLLVAPQPGLEGVHVILSTLDETLVINDASFDLGMHKYPSGFEPKGYLYMKDFVADPIPKSSYRVGDVLLTKEKLLVEHEERILVRYVLEKSPGPIKLRLRPFLAFRNAEELRRASEEADRNFQSIEQGIRLRLYSEYKDLCVQVFPEPTFADKGDWYYNVEYPDDIDRGYDYQEDLYVPGYFELTLNKGDTVVFSAGLDEVKPGNLLRMFNTQTRRRTARNTFENCLKVAADQFVLKTRSHPEARKYDQTDVIASYQRYRRGGRDAFVALPGLSLVHPDLKLYKAALDTMLKHRRGAFFPFWKYNDSELSYAAIDTPLWFFWALQHYTRRLGDPSAVWKTYGAVMREILESFRGGTDYNIKMQEDGLLSGGIADTALTWMDSYVDGVPVTPRRGMPVEVNALWYNAIKFALEIAGPRSTEGKVVLSEWKEVPTQIEQAFEQTFWNEKKGYLADVVDGTKKDWSVRPNQVLAVSLPFSPLKENLSRSVLKVVEEELLTPRGLRSLSPHAPQYRGHYRGAQSDRRRAYHQGSVWPWLSGHFVEAYLKVHPREEALPFATSLYQGFEGTMTEHGISTVSEIYDGTVPHEARGAISQAWSIAELIRMRQMIDDFDKATQPLTA